MGEYAVGGEGVTVGLNIGGMDVTQDPGPGYNLSFRNTTAFPTADDNTTEYDNITANLKSPERAQRDFYIGLTLAIGSAFFVGISYILKKKGLLRLQHRAGAGGFGYLKEWLWWAGLILMAIGEGANFAAYAFAPATLVTPLGALSVLVSAVMASYLLKERLNLLGKIGCFVCVLGSTIVVIHSPEEQEFTMAELGERLKNPVFIVYTILILIGVLVLIFYCGPRWGQTNPLVYISVEGMIGSLSVMACKGLGVAIKETMEGRNQFTNWLTWLMIFGVVGFITVQMNYLNKALDIYNTAVVTPMLYVVFTTFVIVASAILFEEWANLGPHDIVGNVCGLLITVAGIFLLQVFKDMNVSLKTLPKLRKAESVPDMSKSVQNGDIFVTSRNDPETHSILLDQIGAIEQHIAVNESHSNMSLNHSNHSSISTMERGDHSTVMRNGVKA